MEGPLQRPGPTRGPGVGDTSLQVSRVMDKTDMPGNKDLIAAALTWGCKKKRYRAGAYHHATCASPPRTSSNAYINLQAT
jgi:hypothetical protein